MTGSLFEDDNRESGQQPAATPLAERMRPRTLDEFVGQDALIGFAATGAQHKRSRPAPLVPGFLSIQHSQ